MIDLTSIKCPECNANLSRRTNTVYSCDRCLNYEVCKSYINIICGLNTSIIEPPNDLIKLSTNFSRIFYQKNKYSIECFSYGENLFGKLDRSVIIYENYNNHYSMIVGTLTDDFMDKKGIKINFSIEFETMYEDLNALINKAVKFKNLT